MMRATKSRTQQRSTDLAARDRTIMQEIEKEQQERAKKTARLRALRLAKEAADREGTPASAATLTTGVAAAPAKKAARRKPKVTRLES